MQQFDVISAVLFSILLLLPFLLLTLRRLLFILLLLLLLLLLPLLIFVLSLLLLPVLVPQRVSSSYTSSRSLTVSSYCCNIVIQKQHTSHRGHLESTGKTSG